MLLLAEGPGEEVQVVPDVLYRGEGMKQELSRLFSSPPHREGYEVEYMSLVTHGGVAGRYARLRFAGEASGRKGLWRSLREARETVDQLLGT